MVVAAIHDASAGEHDLCADEVIAGQPVLAPEQANPAAGGTEGLIGGRVLMTAAAPVDAAAEELARGEATQPEAFSAEVRLVGVPTSTASPAMPPAPRRPEAVAPA